MGAHRVHGPPHRRLITTRPSLSLGRERRLSSSRAACSGLPAVAPRWPSGRSEHSRDHGRLGRVRRVEVVLREGDFAADLVVEVFFTAAFFTAAFLTFAFFSAAFLSAAFFSAAFFAGDEVPADAVTVALLGATFFAAVFLRDDGFGAARGGRVVGAWSWFAVARSFDPSGAPPGARRSDT